MSQLTASPAASPAARATTAAADEMISTAAGWPTVLTYLSITGDGISYTIKALARSPP